MLVVILLISVFLFIDLDAMAQCSQCKLLAEQSGNPADDKLLGDSGGNNINSAILYIMAVPYIILSFLFRKQIKRLFKRTFGVAKNS
ncbi:MAG: hypothetical protein COA32_00470 [Fluviicola sp.]|nr:MAG: hypothetical protein COA32_00470 [Fluviicola sp.]